MEFWWGFTVGIFIGANVGVVVLGALACRGSNHGLR